MTAVRTTNEDNAGEHTFPDPPIRSVPAMPASRTFDLRTSEERLVMWCAHLEMVQEAHDERIRHLEVMVHRLLNGCVPVDAIIGALAGEVDGENEDGEIQIPP